MMLRAIHVGDLHYWRIPLNPLAYVGKRLLGVGNLVVGGRARKFQQRLMPVLFSRLEETAPDWFLFSGDFTSTAHSGEFRAARRALEALNSKLKCGIRVVPGNHDCYLGRANDAMVFCEAMGTHLSPVEHVQGDWLDPGLRLISCNATTSNGMGSHGTISRARLDQLAAELELARDAESIWFLCHFPQEHPSGVLRRERGPQLIGGEQLLPLFRSFGKPIFWLHGHHHYRWVYRSPTAENLVYVNAGAPTLAHGGRTPDLGFHELQYEDGATRVITHWRGESRDWESSPVRLPSPGTAVLLQR
jgi:3',5'-cyclic AMP phosphodiesterase CpdA